MRRAFAAVLVLILLTGVPLRAYAEAGVWRSVKNDHARIALTFDDGPHPHLTHRILEILEKYGIKATFFMVGVNVENYPDVAREVLAAGHEVGNHTYSHSHMLPLSIEACEEEMGRCEDVLEELCEYRPHLFRPPEGALTENVRRCSELGDYSLILWSLDTRDWEDKNAAHITERVLDSVSAGDIILMHDYIGHSSRTPEALERLIPELLSRGYEFVTVSRLLEGD